MRARDLSLFVICIAIVAPLVMMTGVYSAGPLGTSAESIKSFFSVGVIVGMLAAGGMAIIGFSFKLPAVLMAFSGMYTFCTGLLTMLIGQMMAIVRVEIAAIFSPVFIALFFVIGYFAALEIAGGPHGPMA